jgi:signal transduction histidine kinase
MIILVVCSALLQLRAGRSRKRRAFVTTKSHGMGLGLALCRMIIVRHSGELTASSAHPRGSIFRIGLPISAATG